MRPRTGRSTRDAGVDELVLTHSVTADTRWLAARAAEARDRFTGRGGAGYWLVDPQRCRVTRR